MKIQARYNETVGSLLFKHFGDDSDDLEEQFYILNPTVKTPFLEPMQMVILPEPMTEEVETDLDVVELWE